MNDDDPVGYIYGPHRDGHYEIRADRGERLWADGGELLIEEYPALCTVLAHAFDRADQPDGTFALPDLRLHNRVGIDLDITQLGEEQP